ncbi:non-ribosomal peptide synthetase [Planomonospora parontospora]|uniref:non-ribosomal peptide synthetase n=1 Tax=Planomonospora parontospora TaxID=58119 RepID=UPI001670B542|nr:non-ribosomal peptide synthetase [Planomonospora parontospora]GGL51487.1 non-ribosomal peptide synthetase [Planomonospora parontospora subsp. antibiotica]GII19117.1 non-ribosomal peptide synthetase [Planomonospora parontospora subsp. antibiotica]
MTAGQLIAELAREGVHLWEESGRLRFRAPQGVLTEERRALLAARKDELLEHLRRPAAPRLTPDPAHRHDPFPLTDVQAAYLLGRGDAFDYGGTACQVYAELAMEDLDPQRMEEAWNRLVERHDMLRATVHREGHQVTAPAAPRYRVQAADLTGRPAEEVAAHVAATRAAMDGRVYDPAVWPLFEVRVTRTGERDLLHVSVDFLIADYLSIQLLLTELKRLYLDPAAELPPLEATFRDYVAAARGLRDGAAYERDRRYWEDRIDDLPGAAELPLRERPEIRARGTFTRHRAAFTPEQWQGLRERAAAHAVTPSTAVLAAFAEVVGRWSRQPAFCLNLTLLDRRPLHPQVGSLVGDFTAVSLLEVDGAAGGDFTARAAALQRRLWEDLDHRLYSGVELMREIARRKGRQAALMPVVFTSTVGLGDENEGMSGLAEVVYGRSQTPQVWIDCQALVEGGALEVRADVRDGVLPDGLVEDMFDALRGLLLDLAASDAAWESASPVALPAAQAGRREHANATAAPRPAGLLHEPVVAQAADAPDAPAVLAADRTLTYGELLARATAVAERLAGAGNAPVAIVMDKGWEQVVAVLGTLLAGAAYLPVDTGQPPVRRERILADAGVTTALTQSWTGERPAGVRCIDVDTLPPSTAPAPASPARPGDLAYVIYTSGSTGDPKGVMISHEAVLNTVADVNRRFSVTAADRVLGLAGLGFDLSVYDVFGPLAAGGALVLPDPAGRTDPASWARLIAEHGVTLWNSVPAQLQMLEHYLAAGAGADLPTLRLALLSGDWIPVTLPPAIRAHLPGLELVGLGGATEASIWSIHHPIDEPSPDWTSIPYGKPLANQTFHVLDHALRPCPDWVAGELYIGGAGLALGYLGDPDKTAQRFIRRPETGERLYRTGDLGRYREDGVIEFLGREDRQVKIRGHRIELAEVEAALQEHPAVAAAHVLVDGEGMDRRLAGFAQPVRRAATEGVPAADPARELRTAASRAADPHTAHIDRTELMEFIARLDRAAVVGIMRALAGQGVFGKPGDTATAEQVVHAVKAAPRHHRLVRRWLRVLQDEGFLTREGEVLRAVRTAAAEDLDAAWRAVDELQREDGYPAALISYFKTSTDHLPELVRDEMDPLPLLFPEGRLEISEAAYRENIISRYVNHAAVEMLRRIAARHEGRLRVLEVGAGVGGTSAQTIPALAEFDVDYLFTDVSSFFLTEARKRFGDLPWVRYGLFDVNEDFREQGYAPNDVDVILCANVLHNSRHAGRVLNRLVQMLRPGGWLVFIETTEDSYQIMTSMEFMMPEKDPRKWDYEDLRRGLDQTFLGRGQWLDLLREAGADATVCLPEPHDVTGPLGQHVFAARFKADRAAPDVASLAGHLARRLPEYMIPAHLQIVDELPLTRNGKVDTATLRSWLPRAAASRTSAGGPPRDDLERELAAVWAEVLDLPEVGRDDDFFDLGGDSLVVAKLAAALRERVAAAAGVHWDDLVRHILHRPTVAALAGELRRGGGREETGGRAEGSPLIPLGGDPGAGGPLRVLVHEGSGTLAPYRALSRLLAAGGGPLAGLAVTDVDAYLAEEPRGLIERRAARYARALLDTGAPAFQVVGYCMGGLLATEVARQLTEAGADVAGLTVISSYPLPRIIEDELIAEYVFAKVMGVDPGEVGYPADEGLMSEVFELLMREDPDRVPAGRVTGLTGGPAAAAEAFRAQAARPRAERLAAIGRAGAGHADPAVEQHVDTSFQVVRHSLLAVGSHRPEPYAGDITFLRQLGDTRFLPWLRDDMTGFWRELCLGELRVADIPGDHFGCLRPPHVEEVAALLARIHREGS